MRRAARAIAALALWAGTAGGATADPAAGALATQGDVAYGEYIATECLTCHQRSGHMDGIPAIIGWDRADFIHALVGYKTGARQHPVMQTVTSVLGDAEIAALADYFAGLGAR